MIIILNPYSTRTAIDFCKAIRETSSEKICGAFTRVWQLEIYKKNYDHFTGLLDEVIDITDIEPDNQWGILKEKLNALSLTPTAIIGYDDTNVVPASQCNDSFNLPGLSHDIVSLYKDKHLLKLFLRDHTNIRINQFCLSDTLEDILEFQEKLGSWPIVLKPINAGGSWNVFSCYSRDDIKKYFPIITSAFNEFDISTSPQVLAEEFIGGDYYCVDGQTDKEGNILITDCFDADLEMTKENGFVFHSSCYIDPNDPKIKDVIDYAVAVTSATKLKNAPFHLELKIDEKGPCLIESAPRMSGAGLFQLASRMTETNLFSLAAKGYLNQLRFPQKLQIISSVKEKKHGGIVLGSYKRSGTIMNIDSKQAETLSSFQGYYKCPVTGQAVQKTSNVDNCSYIAYMVNKDKDCLQNDIEQFKRLHSIELEASCD